MIGARLQALAKTKGLVGGSAGGLLEAIGELQRSDLGGFLLCDNSPVILSCSSVAAPRYSILV